MTKAEYVTFTSRVVNATRGLVNKTPEDKLDWRPDPSFMKMSAVLHHVSNLVGSQLSDVMNEAWEYRPAGAAGDAQPSPALPSADSCPTVTCVDQARKMIAADWRLFEERFARVDEDTFNRQVCRIPWMAPGTILRDYMLMATEHLSNHRMQLFLYLRLLGVKVDTTHLYYG